MRIALARRGALKRKRGWQDKSKINKNEPYEVGYAAKKLGTSAAKIHEAIEKVGSGRKAVEKYARKSQQDK
jgi:hypothetical protein